MHLPARLSIEAHDSAATLYLAGRLSASVAVRALAACRALPPQVRAVRVDLHARTVCDLDALLVLESLLIEWRRERRGVTRIARPRLATRDTFVAFPCVVRDAPDAELRPDRDDRVVSAPPSPDW